MSKFLLDFLTIPGGKGQPRVPQPCNWWISRHFLPTFPTARPLLEEGWEHVMGSLFFSALGRHLARLWCALHGHVILLHFEPNKLSLHCALCGYESEGWEVGHPAAARRQVSAPRARPDRRRTLRPLPSGARWAS